MTKERLEEIRKFLAPLKEHLDYDTTAVIEELESTVATQDLKDAYGIPNVCFSLMKIDDEHWDEAKKTRIERGFDDSECWNLDSTIAKFILPRLKVFKEHTFGYPPELTFEEWQQILDDMILAFEYMVDEHDAVEREMKRKGVSVYTSGLNEVEKIISKGFDLFHKYFHSLWW